MSYIIIEKNDSYDGTIPELLLECLDESTFKREDGYFCINDNDKIYFKIRHKNSSKRFYLELKSTLRFNRGVETLQIFDDCLLKSRNQKYIAIIRDYDGISASFCEKLYPKYAMFERRLRQMILLVLTKSFGLAWVMESIPTEMLDVLKKNAKSQGTLSLSETLEQFDLAGMEKFLFEKREIDYKSYLEDALSTNNLRIMEKNEICDVIEKIRPKSLWERNFESIGTQEKWEKQIKDIHDGRNKVAHSKNMRYEEYVSINKMMNAINRDLGDTITKIQEQEFKNINAIDILENFALAISALTERFKKYNFDAILKGVGEAISKLILPVKKDYADNLAKAFSHLAYNTSMVESFGIQNQKMVESMKKVRWELAEVGLASSVGGLQNRLVGMNSNGKEGK